jgi:hypothetical protein
MAGLVPAIHVFLFGANRDVDARNKCGHDEVESGAAPRTINPNSLRLLHVLDMLFCSRGAFCLRPSFAKAKFTKSHSHEKPRAFRVERREAPGSWATPRGRMLPPAHASGVARATERSACANRLLRARCASRRSTTIAVLRQRLSTAAARVPLPLRQPASAIGVLTVSGKIRFLTRNIDLLSSINSYHIETPMGLNLRPRRLSDQ